MTNKIEFTKEANEEASKGFQKIVKKPKNAWVQIVTERPRATLIPITVTHAWAVPPGSTRAPKIAWGSGAAVPRRRIVRL